MALAEEPPVAAIPERLDRRLRLGPFPSARDALKFATYAGVGAVLVPVAGVAVGLVVGSAGFAVSVWRPEAGALDERALAYLAWTGRRLGGARRMMPSSPSSRVRGPYVRLDDGRIATIVQAGGIPLAYLPPAELARRFDQFRDLVRCLDEPFAVTTTWASVLGTPFLPTPTDAPGPDREARAGYRELIEVLARRRRLRRVLIVLTSTDRGPEGVGRLEATAAAVLDRLAALGLRPERLRGSHLGGAARRLGWTLLGDRP